MKIKNLELGVTIPEKVTVTVEGKTVKVKGPNGELSRSFNDFPTLGMKIENNEVLLSIKDANKKEKTHIGTAEAHIANMMIGAVSNHVYKLKICASHFPMTATVSGDTFTVKNFLGEKIPRVTKIEHGVSVKVEGQEITVQGADIEKTGIVAARIEQLTRIVKRDIRIFQDGIYMTKKPKKEISA